MKKTILSTLILSFIILLSCNSPNKEQEKQADKLNDKQLLEQGQSFAMQTQKVLGKNLMNAISTKGTEHALSFCSHEAYPLTDSMAVALNAQIKRVSDKNRNPDNVANQEELDYINKSKELLSKGEKIKPMLTEVDEKLIAYYPIMTNAMCLQCHGTPETEVMPNTIAKIDSLYPDDKAMDYKIDELRGIWVIEMDKQ